MEEQTKKFLTVILACPESCADFTQNLEPSDCIVTKPTSFRAYLQSYQILDEPPALTLSLARMTEEDCFFIVFLL